MRFPDLCLPQLRRVENVLDRACAEIGIRHVLASQGRYLSNKLVSAGKRIAHTVPVKSQNLLHGTVRTEVVDIHARGPLPRSLDIRVEPEIAEHQVRVAVPVEIGGSDAVPPAVGSRQAGLSGQVHEPAALLPENSHRHPFAGHDQIQLAVTIVIDPYCRRHHAGAGERGRLFLRDIGETTRAVILQQMTSGRKAIAAGNDSASDEEVEVSIAIEIASGYGRTVPEDVRECVC